MRKKKPEKIRASIDLTPNVWLGRASHRYSRRSRVESHWSPDFFRVLLSNCLNWKINCDDHSPLSSTTAVQIWIISNILHDMINGNTWNHTSVFDLAPNVWLHSSVGRELHWYSLRSRVRKSHWSPDFFRLLLSNSLRMFARKFSNIDFFLKILPLKDDELVMSEM